MKKRKNIALIELRGDVRAKGRKQIRRRNVRGECVSVLVLVLVVLVVGSFRTLHLALFESFSLSPSPALSSVLI